MKALTLIVCTTLVLASSLSLLTRPAHATVVTFEVSQTLIPSPSELSTSETNILGTLFWYRSSANATNYSNFDVIWGASGGAFVGTPVTAGTWIGPDVPADWRGAEPFFGLDSTRPIPPGGNGCFGCAILPPANLVLDFLGDHLLLPALFSNGNFGWLDVNINPKSDAEGGLFQGFDVTVNSYSYEDTGAAVMAGSSSSSVPAPGALALLGFGLAGLGGMRRKAKAA